jgi:hypothetical protein
VPVRNRDSLGFGIERKAGVCKLLNHLGKVERTKGHKTGISSNRVPNVDHPPEQEANDSEAKDTAPRKNVVSPKYSDYEAIVIDLQPGRGVETRGQIQTGAKYATFWIHSAIPYRA